MDINQILNDHFAEYKEYHIFALIILTLIIAIFQIFQTVFVTKKIEKFKNELKRSEIKFSRFNNLQIDALKSIYDKLVDFHYINYRLFYSENNSHHLLKNKSKNWQKELNSLMDLFHREKILLTEDLKNQIKEIEKEFKIIYKILDEQAGTDDVQIIYKDQETETANIKTRLNRLKEIKEVKNSQKRIKNLRKSVENYFESLTR
jgi:hypothetical protein